MHSTSVLTNSGYRFLAWDPCKIRALHLARRSENLQTLVKLLAINTHVYWSAVSYENLSEE